MRISDWSSDVCSSELLLFVADDDWDAASACAVGLRALRGMGAVVDFLVPNRFETGYGLSPAVVDLALRHPAGKPDMLITVDNGIASIDGVEAARQAGIDVVITDHHLPGDTLPKALAIVNPNQPGRSEEHTSELQSLMRISYAVFCLKKKTEKNNTQNTLINTKHTQTSNTTPYQIIHINNKLRV